MVKNNVKAFFQQAEQGKLPEGFNQWGLVDNKGRTVAHVVVK